MAIGDVTIQANCKRTVVLMPATTANVAAPALATDGVPMYPTKANAFVKDDGICYPGQPTKGHRLFISGTVTTGQTLVGTFTLYGYLAASGKWYPIKVNAASALAETSTDAIDYTEYYEGLAHFDRLALGLASIGGTGASFTAYITAHQEAF